jgi:hypothetical protein
MLSVIIKHLVLQGKHFELRRQNNEQETLANFYAANCRICTYNTVLHLHWRLFHVRQCKRYGRGFIKQAVTT